MKTEDLLGLLIPVTYFAFLLIESRLEGRTFPEIPKWRLVGTGYLSMLMTISATAPLWMPSEWLERYRLMDGSALGTVAGAITGYLTVSFANYWFHRAEHRFHWMWRLFHQLHHSPVRMDIAGSAYTHPAEVVVSSVIFVMITTFGLGLSPVAAALVGYIGAFYSMFQHFNVKTPVWLGYLIERPESHCIHHRKNHHAQNYSDLPLWDILFGTFRNPPDFSDEVGFEPDRARRMGAMLLAVDVNGENPSGAQTA